MKSLVLYDSQGGNTEKVATHVHGSLKESGVESVLIKIASELEIDFYEYDLKEVENRVKGLLSSIEDYASHFS